MGKYKTLLVNLGLFTLNTISTKLITFLLVPLYTFFLTARQYGITDMSMTVASLAIPVLTLSIGDAVTRYVIDDTDDKTRYITVGFWITVFGCLVMFMLLPLLNMDIFGGLGEYKGLYFLYFITSTFNAFFANVARGLNHIKLITWASITSSLATGVSAGVLIGMFGWKVEGYFTSLILGGTVAIAVYLIFGYSWRYISFPKHRKDRHFLRLMLLYSLPLMPNSIFWWLGSSINRFFITTMLGIGASGLFAAASKIPSVMNMISSTFWQAWSLSAFQQFKKTDTARFYSNVFAIFRTFCFIAASGLMLCAPWLSSLLLQKEFYTAWSLVPLLVLAFLFNVFAGFYGTVFTASMQTKYLLTSTAAAAVVVVVLTWLFVPLVGLQGAAWAMVVSNFVMYAMRIFHARDIVHISVNWILMTINCVVATFQAIVMTMQVDGYMTVSAVCFALIVIISAVDLYPSARAVMAVIRQRGVKTIKPRGSAK